MTDQLTVSSPELLHTSWLWDRRQRRMAASSHSRLHHGLQLQRLFGGNMNLKSDYSRGSGEQSKMITVYVKENDWCMECEWKRMESMVLQSRRFASFWVVACVLAAEDMASYGGLELMEYPSCYAFDIVSSCVWSGVCVASLSRCGAILCDFEGAWHAICL